MSNIVIKNNTFSTVGTKLYDKLDLDILSKSADSFYLNYEKSQIIQQKINQILNDVVNEFRSRGHDVWSKGIKKRRMLVENLEWIEFSYHTYSVRKYGSSKWQYRNFINEILNILPRQRVTNGAINNLLNKRIFCNSSRQLSEQINNNLSHSSISYYIRNAHICLKQDMKPIPECDRVIISTDSTFQKRNSKLKRRYTKRLELINSTIQDLKDDPKAFWDYQWSDDYLWYRKVKANIETKYLHITFLRHNKTLKELFYSAHDAKNSKFKDEINKVVKKMAPNAYEYAVAGDYATGIKAIAKRLGKKGKFYGCKWHYLRDISKVFGLNNRGDKNLHWCLRKKIQMFIDQNIYLYQNGKEFFQAMIESVYVNKYCNLDNGEIFWSIHPQSNFGIIETKMLEVQPDKQDLFKSIIKNFAFYKNSFLDATIKHKVEQEQRRLITTFFKKKGAGYSTNTICNIIKINLARKYSIKYDLYRSEKVYLESIVKTLRADTTNDEKLKSYYELCDILKKYSIDKGSSIPIIERGEASPIYYLLKKIISKK